jgi:hypothetical protein
VVLALLVYRKEGAMMVTVKDDSDPVSDWFGLALKHKKLQDPFVSKHMHRPFNYLKLLY